MQPDLLDLHVLHHFRTRSPLTHCMTNDVVQTFTANVLLALGASPAMVIEAEEAEQFAGMADALLINVGTLTTPRAQSMRRAIESAVAAGKPWTLDPVAVGALAFRTRFCHQILALKPAAIRGNASEILALAGMSAGGAVSIPPTPPLPLYPPRRRWLARPMPLWQLRGGGLRHRRPAHPNGCGRRSVNDPRGGHRVCALGGGGGELFPAGERLDNVAAACGWMKRAGTIAVAQSQGPGSFASAFLDALHNLEAQA